MTVPRRPNRYYEYIDDGPAIYVDSFATIRREARLDHLPANAEKLVVRMIHGTGQVDLADDLVIHPELVPAARAALRAGAPILCDATMVAVGVTASRLPRDNQVLCHLRDERVPELARVWGTTRTAAAVSLWEPLLGGAESKQALTELADRHGIDIPYVTALGRRGGSAMTSSALNALAKEEE